MRTRRQQTTTAMIRALGTALTLAALQTPLAQAEDVYLNPGYISGAIGIEGVTVQWAEVKADNDEFSASTYGSANNYTLTVNTPENGSYDYQVGSYVYSDGYNDYLRYPYTIVTVADNATVTNNFSLKPGFIRGTINVADGCSILGGRAYATNNLAQQKAYRDTTLWQGARTKFGADGAFLFPVIPGENVEITAKVTMANGETVELAKKFAAINPGQTIAAAWDVTCGTTPATLKGRIGVAGVNALGTHTVRARKSTASNDYVYATIQCTESECSYEFPALTPGSWTMDAWSYLNQNDDNIRHPKSSFAKTMTVDLASGQTTVNDIITVASFINGNVSLSGTKKIEEATQAGIGAYGDYATNAAYGNSTDKLNTMNGNFDLIVSEGTWKTYYTYLTFYDKNPDNYLNSTVYIYDYYADQLPTLAMLGGESANNINIAYKTGTVTVRYTVENQGILNYPRLNGSGTSEDSRNRLYVYAYGPYQETTEGRVTFIGLPGAYDLKAEAYVGGSLTTFGDLRIDVIQGGEREMDIGGPTLAISSPQPETYTDAESVMVSGKTTDPDAIKKVTVNGEVVPLTYTGDPADPDEVSFAKKVALEPGPNAITVVTYDKTDKMTSDTRKVFRDNGAPTLAWSPANNATVSGESITVRGTATDDNQITTVKVNGEPIAFTNSGNPADPKEVKFSTEVKLTKGSNQIVVSAADNCELITSETHTVTRLDSDPIVRFTAKADARILWPPNHKYATIHIDLTALTKSGQNLSSAVKLVSATSDEPENVNEKGSQQLNAALSKLITQRNALKNSENKLNSQIKALSKQKKTKQNTLALKRLQNSAKATKAQISKLDKMIAQQQNLISKSETAGDGNTTNDIVIIDNNTVQVRVERLGGGDGRVYTFNYSVTDTAGKVSTTSTSVGVPLSINRTPVNSGVKYTVKP